MLASRPAATHRLASVLSLAALPLIALAPAAGAAVHRGLEHTALGAATITISGSSFADRALGVHNIGSSGNDGVSITLPGSDGLRLHYLHSTGLVHRDLALRALVGGAPTTVVTVSEEQVGSDVVVTPDAPGIATMLVEVWDGASLQYSRFHGSNTPIIRGTALMNAPGSEVSVTTARSRRCPECPFGHVILMKREASSPVTIDGTVVTGNAIVCAFETPGATEPYMDAVLTCATAGPPGDLTIDQEGLTSDPSRGKGMNVLAIQSGAVATAGAGGGISLAPDGSSEDFRVSLNGLPPGIPIVDTYLRSASLALSDDYMTGAGPSSMTLQCDVACDDFSGFPPGTCASSVTWSLSPAGYDLSFSNGVPGVSNNVVLLYGGLDQAAAVNPMSLSTDHPPVSAGARCDDGVPMVCLGFPAGTSATLDGSPVACDSIVIVLPTGASYQTLGLREIRLVHPPASPPGSLRGGVTVQGSLTVEGGGLSISGRGPRQTVSLIGSYSRVDNIGSQGSDGVEVALDGLSAIEWRFPAPSPASVPPVRLDFRFYPCDDGDCDDTSELSIEGLAGSLPVAQLGVSIPSHGAHPLYVQVGDQFPDYHDCDDDNDGRIDLSPTTPGGVQVAKVIKRQYTDQVELMNVNFVTPVIMTIQGNNFVTSELAVWRNPDGGSLGDPTPDPVIASLSALPPGIPVPGAPSVCDIAVDFPGIQTAGALVGLPGVSSTINGNAITPTWARVSGNIRVADVDRDGRPDIRVANPASLGPEWTTNGVIEADFTSTAPRGAVFECDLPSLSSAPDESSIDVELLAVRGGVSVPVWSVGASTGGGSSKVKVTSVNSGENINWSFEGGGSLQGVVVGEGPITVTAPPSSFEFLGDPDGDGIPDVVLSGFPPGTEALLGGVLEPCDRVTVHTSGADPVSSLSGARVMVHKLHRGHDLPNARLAEYPDPSVTGVGPRLEAGASLALASPVPNPSTGETSVLFSIAQAGRVRASVIDVAGREVARLADGPFQPGEHSLRWNGRAASGAAAPAGLYFVRVERDGAQARTVRLTHLR